MDALVAKYRRPAAMMQEQFGEEEEMDIMGAENPALSLKFAMPPVTHVSLYTPTSSLLYLRRFHLYSSRSAFSSTADEMIVENADLASSNSPQPGSAQRPTTDRTRNVPSRSPTAPPRSPSASRAASS